MPYSKPNQNCWGCQHFQRYDNSDTPTDPWGECRRFPYQGVQADTFDWENWSPFIVDARTRRCDSWKKSVLVVPPEPAGSPALVWPDVWLNWVQWNVKFATNISCWNCNHWKRDVEDPQDPGDVFGFCWKENVLPTVYLSDLTPAVDILRGAVIAQSGPDFWCGCWEISVQPVPDIPT